MASMLDVYRHEHLVGHLIQGDGGQISFQYHERWLAQPGIAVLSNYWNPSPECFAVFHPGWDESWSDSGLHGSTVDRAACIPVSVRKALHNAV